VAHEHADHVVPGRAQKVGRDTAVDATRHGQHNSRHGMVPGRILSRKKTDPSVHEV
jgi:hypothetical protein